jgi:hypothetical protein
MQREENGYHFCHTSKSTWKSFNLVGAREKLVSRAFFKEVLSCPEAQKVSTIMGTVMTSCILAESEKHAYQG